MAYTDCPFVIISDSDGVSPCTATTDTTTINLSKSDLEALIKQSGLEILLRRGTILTNEDMSIIKIKGVDDNWHPIVGGAISGIRYIEEFLDKEQLLEFPEGVSYFYTDNGYLEFDNPEAPEEPYEVYFRGFCSVERWKNTAGADCFWCQSLGELYEFQCKRGTDEVWTYEYGNSLESWGVGEHNNWVNNSMMTTIGGKITNTLDSGTTIAKFGNKEIKAPSATVWEEEQFTSIDQYRSVEGRHFYRHMGNNITVTDRFNRQFTVLKYSTVIVDYTDTQSQSGIYCLIINPFTGRGATWTDSYGGRWTVTNFCLVEPKMTRGAHIASINGYMIYNNVVAGDGITYNTDTGVISATGGITHINTDGNMTYAQFYALAQNVYYMDNPLTVGTYTMPIGLYGKMENYANNYEQGVTYGLGTTTIVSKQSIDGWGIIEQTEFMDGNGGATFNAAVALATPVAYTDYNQEVSTDVYRIYKNGECTETFTVQELADFVTNNGWICLHDNVNTTHKLVVSCVINSTNPPTLRCTTWDATWQGKTYTI